MPKGGKNKKTYESVKLELQQLGMELLSEEYIDNKTKLNIRDENGYLGFVKLDNLLHNRSFHKFHRSNPYSIDNLKHYMELNFSGKDYPLILSRVYLNATEHLKWQCKCGKSFTRRLHNVISNEEFKCQECSLIERGINGRLDLDVVLKLISSKNFELCGEYTTSDKKMKLRDRDGYYYSISYTSLNVGSMPLKFGRGNDYTVENIKKYIELNNFEVQLISSVLKTQDDNAKFKCLKQDCGEIFTRTIKDFIHGGAKCIYCLGQKVGKTNCLATKNPEIAEEWNFIMNGDLTPYNITCGSGVKVWWKCKKCNHEWQTSVGSRTNLKSGCPNCCSSKMEGLIYNILTKHHIKFKTQHKFDDCKNIFPLPFDFYLEDYNATVEAQGEGHYQPIKFFGGEEKFEKQQIRDQIKRDYCKDNDIKLIEIPYWEFDNIEEILIKELGLHVNT